MQDHPRASHQHVAAALAITLALFTGAAPAQEEKLPPGAKVVRLETLPQSIDLKHRFDYRQVLVTAVLQTGERVDVGGPSSAAVVEELPGSVSGPRLPSARELREGLAGGARPRGGS